MVLKFENLKKCVECPGHPRGIEGWFLRLLCPMFLFQISLNFNFLLIQYAIRTAEKTGNMPETASWLHIQMPSFLAIILVSTVRWPNINTCIPRKTQCHWVYCILRNLFTWNNISCTSIWLKSFTQCYIFWDLFV